MAYDSLQSFVSDLDRAGELRRITAPVDVELEIAEIDGNGERPASRKPSWLTQTLSTPGRE